MKPALAIGFDALMVIVSVLIVREMWVGQLDLPAKAWLTVVVFCGVTTQVLKDLLEWLE